MRYLIIGGGIAGTTAAEDLRKGNAEATITIISEEEHPLYSRVLLPHFVKGKIPRERVFMKKAEWYGAQNIEFLAGVVAKKLDPKNKFVLTSDGREHEYDKLLIATGGDVRALDQNPLGVSYLHSIDDADHLLELLTTRPPERAGILGSGFISLEYINIFADRHIPADLFMRGEKFFGKMLDQDSSDLIQAKAEADGITIHTNIGETQLIGDNELMGVHEGDKDYPLTLLGVGIGIAPDFSWIKEAGIECDRGVKTNEYLETNVADVYAAGDIAEHFDVNYGHGFIAGNWQNATQQGHTVAKVMSGTREAFDLVSSYATNCRGMEMIVIGDVDRSLADQVVIKGSKAEGGITQIFIRGGRVVGATLVNRNADRAPLTKMIKDKEMYV